MNDLRKIKIVKNPFWTKSVWNDAWGKLGDIYSLSNMKSIFMHHVVYLDNSGCNIHIHESCVEFLDEVLSSKSIEKETPIWVESFSGKKGADIPDFKTKEAYNRGESGVRRITREWPYGKKLKVKATTEPNPKIPNEDLHTFSWYWEALDEDNS